jgi:hypothetical protein
VTAGERAGLIAERGKQVHGVSQRRRPVVAELARDHRVSSNRPVADVGADALSGTICLQ